MDKSPMEEKALEDILWEYTLARRKFNDFRSTHEAYAIIKEEFDELWDAIKTGKSIDEIQAEAKQIAAMALGIMLEF